MHRPTIPNQRPWKLSLEVHSGRGLFERIPALTRWLSQTTPQHALSQRPEWLSILQSGLGHRPYLIEAHVQEQCFGYLPLAFVDSWLFGKFLTSLPYLNTQGVRAGTSEIGTQLVERAVRLADDLDVKHLEFRHEVATSHPMLNGQLTSKVHMRLALPATREQLWKLYDPKVRNQVRKGEKQGFRLTWGGPELLDPFYEVLCRNMRDLGTPVYSRGLFESILRTFPADAEFCVIYDGSRPIATALLLHGVKISEVPTASSLRDYNASCVNMWMYHALLERALDRQQSIFDFGRSTTDGPTYKFKKQWGAQPEPAVWQFYYRQGQPGEMRPDHPKYQRMIRCWQKLPLALTRWIGPSIVRGIP